MGITFRSDHAITGNKDFIPLGIQIATMIVCFVALFILVGRMEEKDAYTFAY